MPLVKSKPGTGVDDDATSGVLGANDSGVVGVAANEFVAFSVADATPEDSGRRVKL